MELTLNSWNNGLGFCIPDKYLHLLGFKPGEKFLLNIDNNRLVFERKIETLDELVSQITVENKHAEAWPDMKPLGKELI